MIRLHQRNQTRKPGTLIASGVLTGLANAVLSHSLITALSPPHSPYSGTLALHERIFRYLGNTQASLLLMELVVETVNKTFYIVLAAVSATFFICFFRHDKRRIGKKGPIRDGMKRGGGRPPPKKNYSFPGYILSRQSHD